MGKLLASLSVRQRVTIVTAAVLVAVALWAFTGWWREADFHPVFTGMAAEDAGAVVQKLKESGVAYRISEDGGTVLVPSARVAEMRLSLAASGLPRSGRIGYELFDKTNFGATEFTEHLNYRRALEGELERSVRALTEVEQARVHVTFPRESVFLEARQPAKASVLVQLRPGAHLAPANVVAICHLVASAVEDLAPEAVSVLDMRGNLLSRGRRPADPDGAEPSEGLLDYRRRIEADLLVKINAALDPLMGAERFHASVSVECDFTASEQSEESFDPTHSVMANSEKTEDVAGTVSSAGVPGTASSLPRPAPRPAPGAGGTTRRTESITYQTSRTTRHLKLPQGGIKKIWISLLLDQGGEWVGQGAAGHRVVAPPDPERLKSIRELVSAAAGLTPERGDQLVVETLPFASPVSVEPPGPRDQAPRGPGATPRAPNWMDRLHINGTWQKLLLPLAVAVVLLLGVGIVVVKLMRRGPMAGATASAALAVGAARASGAEGSTVDQQIEARIAERENLQRQLEAEAINSLKLPPVATKKTEVLTKHLRENVKKDPSVSSQVLLGWVREGEP